jgi:ribonuclease HI
MLTLQFDGLFRGAPHEMHLGDNAGFMCYGWVIIQDHIVIARGHGGYARRKDASSNVAEYLALVEGLEALLDMDVSREVILVRGDAKSVIEQMEGRATVSASSIKPLHRKARKLAKRFQHIHWSWTPRRYNHTADALTRRALRQIRANLEQYAAMLDVFGDQPRDGQHSNRLQPILDLRIYTAAASPILEGASILA